MKPAAMLLPILLATAAHAGAVQAQARDGAGASAGATAALGVARQRTLYLSVIESLREEGKPHAALAHLDAFDQRHPREPRSQVLRADCLFDIGDLAAAEALYRKAVAGPLADEAEAGLGRIAAARGDWSEAAAAFARAVGRKPARAVYLNDLGYALIEARRPEEARFRLRQAAELAPEDDLIRNNLALAERRVAEAASDSPLAEPPSGETP